MQSLFLASLGIITERNKIASTQPGSLTANSFPLVCRSPGVMEAAPIYATALTVSTLNRSYVFSIDKYVLIVSNRSSDNVWVYRWLNTNTAAVDYGPLELENTVGVNDTMDFTGRFGLVTVRDRTLLTCAIQLLVADYILPTTTAQATFRTPGVPTPIVSGGGLVSSGSAMPPDRNWSGVVVLRRKMADGYEIFSAPSTWLWGTTGGASGTSNINIVVTFSGSHFSPGDTIEWYRTKSQVYSTPTYTNTGSDYFLATSVTMTAPDIAGFQKSFVDSTPDSSLGEALYTNTGVSGGNAVALTPPSSKTIAYYRGHTFYSNYTQPAAWEIRVGAFWGFMSDSATGLPVGGRKSGIGSRIAVGNTTIGSPTITAVSANDIVGIVIGQQYSTGTPVAFSFANRVTAVGATTITFNANAIANSTAGTHFIDDVIELTYAGATTVRSMSSVSGFAGGFIGSNAHLAKFSLVGIGVILSPSFGSYSPGPLPSESLQLYLRYLDGVSSTNFFSVRATNGANYVPALPKIELAETAQLFTSSQTKNGVAWSEKDQPEYWCGTNVDNVGGGEIYAVASTRDALWYFCTDGIWRWSGTGGSVADGYDWRLDPIDKTFVIAGPQAYCVLRDNVYAYGNRGFIMVDSSGNVTEISAGRCDDVMPGRTWIELAYPGNVALQFLDGPNGYYLVADDKNNEVILKKKDLDNTGLVWIYNVHQDCITRDTPNVAAGLQSPDHGVWNESKAQIYHACTNTTTNVLTLRTNNTASVPSTTTWEFQPVVADDPFTLRQFQRVEVTFDIEAPTFVTLTCRFNDNGATDQTRTFAAATGPSVNNRLSFIVPRNAPAVANTIKIQLVASGSGQAFIRLLGVALKYSTPTEQRKAR